MRNFLARAILSAQYKKDLKRIGKGAISMTYNLMKRLIQRGGYDRESTLKKLDVFLMADRISPEEYAELAAMIGGDGDE